MDDTTIPSTSEQWFEVLTSEEAETESSYFAKPSNLIRDYRSELATSNDYEGREILELLQNAADQAKEAGIDGKVAIELLPQGIVIANNGNAFSIGGVKSLQNAHLSPKRLRERQYIGCKGLGFRAILNWTNSPIILSGALALAYTEKVSKQKLESLKTESIKLAELVDREKSISSSTILPTLPFPGFSKTNDLDAFFCERSLPLKHRCQFWREQGYTTVVGIPFEHDESFSKAQQQIEALRPEMLLFVKHLDQIKFVLPEEKERVWSKEGNDAASMVLENDEPLGIWKLFRTEGLVDSELLDSNQNGDYHYELIAAVPEVEDRSELKSSPLFTYFPTEILLPLPIVCHATLELDQSRNHISTCKSNEFIFTRLASFLAEVAETCAIENPVGDKAGFRVVMPIEPYPQTLNKFNLESLIIEACQLRAIIPSLGGTALKPNEAFTIKGASGSWLPIKGFESIAPTDVADYKWFKTVGVAELSDEQLKACICGLKDLSIEERVKLILGLKANKVSEKAYSPSLFLSTDGQSIPDSEAVYISPKGGVPTGLPNWIKLWFLDVDMQESLSDKLDAADVRILQNKLKEFGLKEYSFARLIGDLRTQATKYKKDHPELAEVIEQELLKVVYGFYLSEGEGKQRPNFPEKTSIELPSQSGTLVKSDLLYLGSGYGLHGNITQQLYAEYPDKLVASPESFDIDLVKNHEWRGFLEWIGVAKWPREIKIKKNNKPYLEVITEQLKFPVSFGHDYIFQSAQELKSSNLELTEYISLDSLHEILIPPKYTAILAWLSFDERVVNWLKKDHRFAKFVTVKPGDRSYRNYSGDLPSYIQWKVTSSTWLQGSNYTKLKPKDCVITDSLKESIFPKPSVPSDAMLRPYGIDRRAVLDSWRKSGVITSIAELTLDDIYRKLLELPVLQPNPSAAKTLYRWMLNAIDSASGGGVSTKERFIQNGKMWGKKSGEYGYFSINELVHADSDGLPNELLDHLAVVELPNRVGGEKVKRAFGIQPVERSAIKQIIDGYSEAPAESDIDLYFQQAKPFFKYLRASQSGQSLYISSLNKLELKVCSQLYVQMQFNEVRCSYQLPEWGWLIDNDILYIRSSANLVTHNSDMLADAIGEALASLFRIANGGDFARLFRCRANERITLLGRILGEEVLNEQLGDIAEHESDELDGLSVLSDISTIEEPAVIHTANRPSEKPKPAPELQKDPLTVSNEASGTLSIKPVKTSPKQLPAKQKLRVKSRRNFTTGWSRSYQPVSGDFVESKIMEIEESFTPPRYPLLVGQYMGNEGLGCDILSFGSEEARERFRSNKHRDLREVERFIEAKGKGSSGASIELRGNEKKAAMQYSTKYYLYRLFQSPTGEFRLSILKNPLGDVETVEHSLYVHMDRSKQLEEFEVSTIVVTTDEACDV
ncbi:sacsin N-terminal ATP-binding-like domain-containing protein [Shewanella frigidimarina]|uniref:sacsin N-terminal ATP-binding-like domain-containing protein n=1 Tax=Shewanella frigidimarina TaxID=56812 RepID=UPI003D7A85DB